MKKNILQYVCPKFKTSHQKSGPKQNTPQVKTSGGVGGMDMGVGKKAKKKKEFQNLELQKIGHIYCIQLRQIMNPKYTDELFYNVSFCLFL